MDTRYNIRQVRIIPDSNWIEGKIDDYNFAAKVYKNNSRFGINNGNVSKLSVWRKGEEPIINYDRGWNIMPQNKEEEKMVDTLLDYCRNICDRLSEIFT